MLPQLDETEDISVNFLLSLSWHFFKDAGQKNLPQVTCFSLQYVLQGETRASLDEGGRTVVQEHGTPENAPVSFRGTGFALLVKNRERAWFVLRNVCRVNRSLSEASLC